jgi:hypothetical protein
MIAIQLPTIHYSTISYNRLMSVDMPFANPKQGSPFGDKNGPAIALVGAFSAISAGAALGGFLGGVMIVGGIMSGLGAITGNKTLSMIGGVMSLAGGIGSGFTSATTGEFMNPFAEGASFSDTVMGQGFAKVKGFFTPESIGTSDAVQALNIDGSAVTEGAFGVNPDTLGTGAVETGSAFGVNPDTLANTANAVPKPSGGGLLSQFGGGGKDLLNLVSGAAGGYMENEKLEQQQPLYDARTDQANAETKLLENRYNNMQSQPNVAATVNDKAQVFNKTPGSTGEGKYAVVVNGEVKYITQAEYDAMRTNPGGGLLNQGAQA